MIDIPMVTKQPMRLSELDTAYFGKNQPAPVNLNGLDALERRQPAPPGPTPPVPPRPAPPAPPRPAPLAPPRPAPPPPRPPKRRPAGDGIPLQKGQKTSLSQMNVDLDVIEVALGWDLGPGGQGYELDVEAFLLDQTGKVPGDDWFVFYNQPVSPDGAVRLLGSGSAGDDAVVQVRLKQLHSSVARIAFIITINEARERGYNFSRVQNAYVRIVDKRTAKELVRFQLTEYYNTVCSMVAGEVYQYKNEWRFNPVGDGTGEDLAGLCRRYGVNV